MHAWHQPALALPGAETIPGSQTCKPESVPKFSFFSGKDVWGADVFSQPVKGAWACWWPGAVQLATRCTPPCMPQGLPVPTSAPSPPVRAGTVAQLAVLCMGIPECRAFTTSGYLKRCSRLPPPSEWKDWAGASPCEGLFVKDASVAGPCTRCTDIYCAAPKAPTGAGAASAGPAAAGAGPVPALEDPSQQIAELWLTILTKAGSIIAKIKARLNAKEQAYCTDFSPLSDPMRQVGRGPAAGRAPACAAPAAARRAGCRLRGPEGLGDQGCATPAAAAPQVNCVFGFVLAEFAKATTAKCALRALSALPAPSCMVCTALCAAWPAPSCYAH